jgi:hypothetical protein
MTDQTTPERRRSWRVGRLHLAVFRAVTGSWTREGKRKAFGVYAPIPGTPIPDGTKSAAVVAGAWMVACFVEQPHA